MTSMITTVGMTGVGIPNEKGPERCSGPFLLAWRLSARAKPALTSDGFGAVCAPLLSTFIDAHGWRAGCIAVAVCTAIGGGAALLLMPLATVGWAQPVSYRVVGDAIP